MGLITLHKHAPPLLVVCSAGFLLIAFGPSLIKLTGSFLWAAKDILKEGGSWSDGTSGGTVFASVLFTFPPLLICLRCGLLQQMCQRLPFSKKGKEKIHARSRKWVMNNHGKENPKIDILSSKHFIVGFRTPTAGIELLLNTSADIYFRTFPPGGRPRLDLSVMTWEREGGKKKISGSLATASVCLPQRRRRRQNFTNQKRTLPISVFPTLAAFFFFCAAWRFTSRLKLIFSPRRSIGCNQGST